MSSLEKQIAPVVKAIKDGRKATFFLGAGVSTSCGIPDFRSPKTGLYANLKRLNLPYPEAVFDIDYFKEDPKAFYTLCEELYPGKFLPSKFHHMLKLFQDKKLLHRVYTQNIDTLEGIAGVHDEYVVAAHGSFASNHCIECSEAMSTTKLKQLMTDKDTNEGIPKCASCDGLVKPDIVFFGEALPSRFFDLWDEDAENVELAIVAGTSLSVYPFASLPLEVGKSVPRVLVNNEIVGDFTTNKRKNDVILKHDCDTVASALIKALGWEDDFDAQVKEIEQRFEKNSKVLEKADDSKASESSDTAKKIDQQQSEEELLSRDLVSEAEKAQQQEQLSAAEESEKLADKIEKQMEGLRL